MKSLNLLIILTLISFLSIILVTGSPVKNDTNFFDYNNPILLEIPSIQAQDNGDGFEDDGGNDDFAGFEEDDNDGDGGNDDFAAFEEEDNLDNEKENEEDTNQFSFESETEDEDQESEQEDIEEDQQTEVENTPFTFVAKKTDLDTKDAEETEDQATEEAKEVETQEEDEGGNDDATQATDKFAFETEEPEETEDGKKGDQQRNPQGPQDEGTDNIAESIMQQVSDTDVKAQEEQQAEGTDDIEEQIQKQAKQIQEQEEQQTFREDIEQKINQMANQIAKSSEDQGSEEPSNVQQLIKKIVTQPSKDDSDVNQIVDQISKQIDNNPKSDLAKSLGNLAGLYGSGNKDQVNQAIKQIGTQIAIGDNINQNTIQNIVQKAYQVTNNYFKNKIKYDIDYDERYHDNNDDDNIKVIKKVYKKGNSCPTQSDSIQLKGKILGKGVIVLADFEPCELRDGRATLNIPTNPNLKFVVLSIDKKGNEYDGIIVSKQKIQSLNKDSSLYVINFDNKITGTDPITGKKKTIGDINGLALYNTATKSLNFKAGNSLALTALLKK